MNRPFWLDFFYIAVFFTPPTLVAAFTAVVLSNWLEITRWAALATFAVLAVLTLVLWVIGLVAWDRMRSKTRINWIASSISCNGKVVCAAISPNEPLRPLRTQIAFRANLLYNAWQAYACEGRQMSLDDFNRMEDFEERFLDTSLDENAIRMVVDDFGDFIPRFLAKSSVDVPERALIWTKKAANNPMHGSGEAEPIEIDNPSSPPLDR